MDGITTRGGTRDICGAPVLLAIIACENLDRSAARIGKIKDFTVGLHIEGAGQYPLG
jgi:hypothetical protein